jgi:FAD synthetase
MKRVMVFGTYDILHEGHKYFFSQARKQGEHLTVVVARDSSVLKIKGCLPINNQNVRISRIDKLGLADAVVLGGKENFFEIISRMKPDTICLGYDQKSFDVEKAFPEITFIRIQAFKSDVYKSSLLKQKK